ncbi:uncharacterized protein PAC_18745 [Phialocephala subalpina]|uniref:Uncharacterized protein n=1 Tax=Phialocephala subalpina TaxID=576137 RepID=A0A1L7XV39_9HELO|nr:uncharacterized protein PAC_18745 [Phialocephala subalpina]
MSSNCSSTLCVNGSVHSSDGSSTPPNKGSERSQLGTKRIQMFLQDPFYPPYYEKKSIVEHREHIVAQFREILEVLGRADGDRKSPVQVANGGLEAGKHSQHTN